MLLVPLLACACASAEPVACTAANGITLQILGSGGPVADDGRASSSYLVWVDGESKLMIDTGGGAFLRFGESGASFDQLDFIGISHFHTDHSADLPALLKSGYFSNRQRPLEIAGPGGSDQFPGLQAFLQSMIGRESGAYAYLAGYLDGTGGLVKLSQYEVDEEGTAVVHASASVTISAMRVPHGIVPAVAYRVEIGVHTVVFASDQNGDDKNFIDFAKNADVLVMHMPVPEGIGGAGRRLHAPPSVIANIATEAGAGQLVLSHFMARSLSNFDENLAIVRAGFDGIVRVAEDLACVSLSD